MCFEDIDKERFAVMKCVISKIEVSLEQLDWAIRLFLDHQAYIPAITLAAASEEILGKSIGQESAFNILKNKFVSELCMEEKDVSQNYLNRARNWLKHWDTKSSSDTTVIELDKEAMQYIVRAIINLVTHDPSRISEGSERLRFVEWITKNDLWPGVSSQ